MLVSLCTHGWALREHTFAYFEANIVPVYIRGKQVTMSGWSFLGKTVPMVLTGGGGNEDDILED